jgi:hypothetical protein
MELQYTPKADDSSCAMKRRIYSTLRGMTPEVRQLPPMWIILINPSPDWSRVWNNVSQSYLQDGIGSTWYRWYMTLLPTQITAISYTSKNLLQVCGMCAKGFCYPSFDDMWDVCWNLVLDANDGDDGNANWSLIHSQPAADSVRIFCNALGRIVMR